MCLYMYFGSKLWEVLSMIMMQAMMKGNSIFEFDGSKPVRIGILPRYAKNESAIKWFELPTCYVFHNGKLFISFRLEISILLLLTYHASMHVSHIFRVDIFGSLQFFYYMPPRLGYRSPKKYAKFSSLVYHKLRV